MVTFILAWWLIMYENIPSNDIIGCLIWLKQVDHFAHGCHFFGWIWLSNIAQ
jgi:hypothetical protein